jgi:Family of unknown function (DUF5681)
VTLIARSRTTSARGRARWSRSKGGPVVKSRKQAVAIALSEAPGLANAAADSYRGNSVRNTDGLVPWAPGQSGNPSGRPKSKPFKEALEKVIREAGTEKPALEEIAFSVYREAKRGEIAAIKEIADRLDGKVPQELGGSRELGPIALEFGWRDDSSQSITPLESTSEASTIEQSALPVLSATEGPEKP